MLQSYKLIEEFHWKKRRIILKKKYSWLAFL